MADYSPSAMRKAAPWAVPVGVGAIIAGIAFLPSVAFGKTSAKLPPKNAGELLAAVEKSSLTAISGTIVETARLGLPSLPDTGGQDLLSVPSLLTGSHTMRVWIDGPQKQRVALLGTLSEADIVHNGDQLWSYSSRGMKVTHEMLKHDAGVEPAGVPLSTDELLPQQAAQEALKALDPSTNVSVDHNTVVAGRATYTLNLSPKDSRSTVTRVALSIDGATGVPLRVQIFGSSSTPAFETGFTDVSFSRPAASVFDFTPPAGATVQQGNPLSFGGFDGFSGSGPVPGATERLRHNGKVVRAIRINPDGSRTVIDGSGGKTTLPPDASLGAVPNPFKNLSIKSSTKEIGKGWTTVVELVGDDHGISGLVQSITQPRSDGSYLLQSSLINVLVTKDGKVFIGAVSPEFLSQVAASAK